jgi:hypothetical protein
MKITYDNFNSFVKTKSEPSSLISDLWVSRSVIGFNIHNRIQAIFGFSAGFNKKKCETNSAYELLEHLVFTPDLYDEKSLNKPVIYLSEALEPLETSGYIKEFLMGSAGPQRSFYGNGCAIFDNVNDSVMHSRRELIERHICCEVWYKRSIKLISDRLYTVNLLIPSMQVKFYTINTLSEDKFAIVTLECEETGFFAMGAAIRSCLKSAYEHALSEVAMIFEDFIKGRNGNNPTEGSQKKILSLRDKKISRVRKEYFENLEKQVLEKDFVYPEYQSIVFEPLAGVYAARTFSGSALDPRLFEGQANLPTLPLF